MAAGPGVTYALRQSDHRLIRLILDTGVAAPPVWRADAVAQQFLSPIFTGRSISVEGPPLKYEWQWAWYEETS